MDEALKGLISLLIKNLGPLHARYLDVAEGTVYVNGWPVWRVTETEEGVSAVAVYQ